MTIFLCDMFLQFFFRIIMSVQQGKSILATDLLNLIGGGGNSDFTVGFSITASGINNSIQACNDKLAGILTSKGISASGSESLNDLIDKVNQLVKDDNLISSPVTATFNSSNGSDATGTISIPGLSSSKSYKLTGTVRMNFQYGDVSQINLSFNAVTTPYTFNGDASQYGDGGTLYYKLFAANNGISTQTSAYILDPASMALEDEEISTYVTPRRTVSELKSVTYIISKVAPA